MKLLYDTITATLRPYPRDDDGPVIGLDPRYLEMVVSQDPQPSYDPATEQLQPTEVIDTTAQTVTRGWDVLPLPPPPPPAPDWIGFYDALISSTVYASVLGQATQSTELVAYMVALSAALADAKAGRPNIPAIQAAVDLVATTAQLTDDERDEIQAMLTAANLDDIITLPPA
jgi:hypothetical protein